MLKILEGNGQKVYIDLSWINSFKPLFIPDDIDTPTKESCKKAIEYLSELGYEIITDSELVDMETFCFTPCLDKHIYKEASEYKANKNDKIKNILALSKVREPISIKFTSSTKFPEKLLRTPFVLKDESKNGGIDKILIENEEQLAIFKRFYEEIDEYSFLKSIEETKRFWHLGDDVVFREDGSSNSPISIFRINYKKLFYDNFIMQEYIDTPTEFNTSLRVIVSSSLDVMCASLKYSKIFKSDDKEFYGRVDKYLMDETSPYYLGSKLIVSNTVAGGNSILLGKSDYSDFESKILKAHGIDSSNAVVPEDVSRAACIIMKNCQREIGAISGMDFIYDAKTKKWKYLEEHEFPMMNTYCWQFGLSYADVEDELAFLEAQCNADIDARIRALGLFMEKKKNNKVNYQKMIKK